MEGAQHRQSIPQMNHFLPKVFAPVLILIVAGCMMASTTQETDTEEITGRVLSKSDVETREDRPIQVLILAIPPAEFDSLLQDVDGPDEPTGDIINIGATVENKFSTYASGHDVSGENGQYRIQVEDSGRHFLCLTGETEVPEEGKSWSVAGCMKVEVPEGETVEQDLYMQFGSLVSPR